jgi:hypothetical protein
MTASLLLRLAAIGSLFFAAGHSLGGLQSWSPPGETPVLQAMRAFRFDADGVSRTYWDFYIGFGLIISVFLFAQSVMQWQLAAFIKTDAVRVRALLAVLFVSAVANAALTWKFFFALPIILAVTIATVLGLALAMASCSIFSNR